MAERIAIVLRPDMPAWQALNVAAFLASGIAADAPDVLGEPYRDGSGRAYCRLFNRPVVVFQAPSTRLRGLVVDAHDADVTLSVFSEGMSRTANDADNRGTIAGVATSELDLLGVALFGPRHRVTKLLEGIGKHD